MKAYHKRNSSLGKVGGYFNELDLFGTPVQFKVKGAESFKSTLGALVSLLLWVAVLTYGARKWDKMYTLEDTTFQQTTERPDVLGNYTFGEMGFNFEFSIMNGKGNIPRQTEGYINYKVVLMNRSDVKDKDSEIKALKTVELSTHRCNENDLQSRVGLENLYASRQFGLM